MKKPHFMVDFHAAACAPRHSHGDRVDGSSDAYFWATHQGAELDLLLLKGGRRLGVEIKRMDAPKLTASMRIALADLKLDQLTVVYPGTKPYELAPKAKVVPLVTLAEKGIDAFLPERRPRSRLKKPAGDPQRGEY